MAALAVCGTPRAHWFHLWRLTGACVVTSCSVTVMCICDNLQADNRVGVEGAKALAPELGKLTQLQTLNLKGE